MMPLRRRLAVILLLVASLNALPIYAAAIRSFMDSDRAFTFEKGSGFYQVRFNYTGKNWTHADVAGVRIHTEKPIAVLPMQYTDPSAMQPGAMVDGRHVGKEWNIITQRALARRLVARGFFVLTPYHPVRGGSAGLSSTGALYRGRAQRKHERSDGPAYS